MDECVYIYICMYTFVYLYVLMYTDLYKFTKSYKCIHMNVYIYINIYIHTHTHSHTPTHPDTSTHTHIPKHIHIHTQCIYTYTSTYTHLFCLSLFCALSRSLAFSLSLFDSPHYAYLICSSSFSISTALLSCGLFLSYPRSRTDATLTSSLLTIVHPSTYTGANWCTDRTGQSIKYKDVHQNSAVAVTSTQAL